MIPLKLSVNNPLPSTGFLRLTQVIGCPKQGIPALIPVSQTAWYAGIRAGKYPKPIKLNERTAAYKVEDIKALIERLSSQQA